MTGLCNGRYFGSMFSGKWVFGGRAYQTTRINEPLGWYTAWERVLAETEKDTPAKNQFLTLIFRNGKAV